ncbi:hypothetical protein [Stenotrophomonas maltophilia]|uniref:hypothetical protein n=1 Tax=Stenotrophomonas maltophilia TaxID=40324 RepID=UPI0034E22360
MLAGGPPCQGCARIDHRGSHRSTRRIFRRTTAFRTWLLIHRSKSKAFLIENMRGQLTARWNDIGSEGEMLYLTGFCSDNAVNIAA